MCKKCTFWKVWKKNKSELYPKLKQLGSWTMSKMETVASGYCKKCNSHRKGGNKKTLETFYNVVYNTISKLGSKSIYKYILHNSGGSLMLRSIGELIKAWIYLPLFYLCKSMKYYENLWNKEHIYERCN